MGSIGDYLPFLAPRRRRSIPRTSIYDQPFLPPTAGSIDDILEIENVDLCCQQNCTDHNTNRFVSSKEHLIVRRGEPFKLIINLKRTYDPSKDAISFLLTLSDIKTASPSHGTFVPIAPNENNEFLGDKNEWGVVVESEQDKMISVLVKPPVNCFIGIWQMKIDTKHFAGHSSKTYSVNTPIYILFNPWCQDDQVFMEDSECRNEYVLNDMTLIWKGSCKLMQPTIWNVGQFESDILECSIKLITEVKNVPKPFRGDAVQISRALCAAINSQDGRGVMACNWSGGYAGGVAPSLWQGSTEILQKFYETSKTVKYAQCFVLAGVLTTVARALGIPSRAVTNYSSAHDTQGSLSVDYFFDENNERVDVELHDSVWDFHVWNEVWMDRPDLDGHFGGWQVIDATPQEATDIAYSCGPISVAAVKRAEIHRAYGGHFVYAAVNAHSTYWRYHGPNSPMKLIRRDTKSCSQCICTKAVGKFEREDITHSYKCTDKTIDDCSGLVKALEQKQHAFSRFGLNDSFNDVDFELNLPDDIKIGENFSIVVKISNRSKDKQHVAKGLIRAKATQYTGRGGVEVKSMNFEASLRPRTSDSIRLIVYFEDYYAKLFPEAAFSICCFCKVNNTDWEYIAQENFRVRKPDVKMKPLGELFAKQTTNVTLKLTNPLPIPLKRGLFFVDGLGIKKPQMLRLPEIPVGGSVETTFPYTPPQAGSGILIAKLAAKELDDVDGYFKIKVEPEPEPDDKAVARNSI